MNFQFQSRFQCPNILLRTISYFFILFVIRAKPTMSHPKQSIDNPKDNLRLFYFLLYDSSARCNNLQLNYLYQYGTRYKSLKRPKKKKLEAFRVCSLFLYTFTVVYLTRSAKGIPAHQGAQVNEYCSTIILCRVLLVFRAILLFICLCYSRVVRQVRSKSIFCLSFLLCHRVTLYV